MISWKLFQTKKIEGVVALGLFLFGSFVSAAPCDWTTPLVNLQTLRDRETTALKALNRASQLNEERWSAARSMVDAYYRREFATSVSRECLAKIENPGNFLQLVQSAFLSESLEKLSSAKAPRLRELMKRFDRGGSALVFRLSGGSQFAAPPTELKAGFHRGSKSVFMDVSRIDPGEWLIVLTHELIHDADDLIPAGVERFSRVEDAKDLAAAARGSSVLSAADRERFKEWIQAGMDRGLLAEVRAWALTILIYQDGLEEGLWTHVGWLDEIIAQKPADQDVTEFTLRFLTARSTQPASGLFALSLTRQLLDEVKEDLLAGRRPLQFGVLAPLLR